MSTVIAVENLGKKYLLGQKAQQGSYVALRDIIADGARNLGRRAVARLGGGGAAPREEFWALREVSFEVQQGDRIGIIGRNGAGKSTLLKILSRITEPTTGSARLRGRVASLLEIGTGFHPELTGRENIYLNGAILGMSRSEIKRKFDEIVDFAEVEKFLDTPVKRYSSGMYVRLAFAVAAHLEPEILVVDEVLAVGDVQFQRKCLGRMEEIGKGGRTVLFVSHNMAAVNALCNRAIWLDKGRFAGSGRTAEVIKDFLAVAEHHGADTRHRAPESARVALERVWIESADGTISSELDVTKHFDVHIDFTVRERVSDVEIGIWIRNGREVPVCFTNLSEGNGGEIPVFTPGRYSCSFRVPALFFVPDIYRLMVKANVANVATEDHIPNAGEFTLVETGSQQGRYTDSWRYGVVLGNFHWKVSRG